MAEKQVDTKHKEFEKRSPDYIMINDLKEGERAIKAAGTRYTPMLTGMESTPQGERAYQRYKDRGEFFNAFSRTVQGIVGSIFRVDPDFGEYNEEVLKTIGVNGCSFNEITEEATEEVVSKGRFGILIDSKPGEESGPYMAIYYAEDIINWRTQYIEGEERLTFLVLKEMDVKPKEDDPFVTVETEQYRVAELDGENKCIVTVWQKTKDKESKEEFAIIEGPFEIKVAGARIDYIPFTIVGSENNQAKPNVPPLLDLANLNISHWKKSVDKAHGLHWTALPTPVAMGFNLKPGQTLTVGSETAWTTTNENAKAMYLEFSGQGLQAVETALDKNERQMAVLGARIIEPARTGVEAAETARLRQAGEVSTLIKIVNQISQGLTKALEMFDEWSGGKEGAEVKLNTEFVDQKLSAEMLTAITGTFQAGGLSKEAFVYNTKRGDLLPPDMTEEDEITLIDEQFKTLEFDNNDGEDDFEDEGADNKNKNKKEDKK